MFMTLLAAYCLSLSSCCLITTTYSLTKGTIVMAYKITKFAGKTVYKIGEFTFEVVTAPLSWPLTHDEIETIDGAILGQGYLTRRIGSSNRD